MNTPSPGPADIKVSVAMVTYNHEAFIAQAIESVLMQQTDFDFELVIGEDCSTDGTRAIVHAYGKRYPDQIRPAAARTQPGGARQFCGIPECLSRPVHCPPGRRRLLDKPGETSAASRLPG